jgi:hypothetical protein
MFFLHPESGDISLIPIDLSKFVPYTFAMARLARVIAPGYPHHVTQRGVRSLPIFRNDEDRNLFYYQNNRLSEAVSINHRLCKH